MKETVGMAPHRCGECYNCKHVAIMAKGCMANPPFTHADQATVDMWNKTLLANPCERPKSGVADDSND